MGIPHHTVTLVNRWASECKHGSRIVAWRRAEVMEKIENQQSSPIATAQAAAVRVELVIACRYAHGTQFGSMIAVLPLRRWQGIQEEKTKREQKLTTETERDVAPERYATVRRLFTLGRSTQILKHPDNTRNIAPEIQALVRTMTRKGRLAPGAVKNSPARRSNSTG